MKSDWKTYRIGDLFEVQLGKMLNKKARTAEALYPYLANFNVQWGRFNLSSLNQMYFDEREKEKFLLQKGDLLVCEGGEIGRCAVWRDEINPCYYQKALHRLRPWDKQISTEYMSYYMQLMVENGLAGIVGESSIAHLTREKLLEIRLTIPSRHEQDKITGLIFTWDTAIEKTEKLIEAKEKRLSWVRQNILTGKKHLLKRKTKWQKQHLRDVLNEHLELSTGEEEVHSVSVHKGIVNQIEHLGRVFAAKDTARYSIVKHGDIVYTKSPTGSFPFGIIKQSLIKKNVIVSPLYGAFTPTSFALGTILDCYFESAINTSNYLSPLIQKGAKNTINITNQTFLSGTLHLPTSSEEQEAIAGIIGTIRSEIDLLKKQAEAYRTQKRGLMQKLLTGQWRVKAGVEVAG